MIKKPKSAGKEIYRVRIPATTGQVDFVLFLPCVALSGIIWWAGPPQPYLYHLAGWGLFLILYLAWPFLSINYLLVRSIATGHFEVALFRGRRLQWTKLAQPVAKWWNYTQLPEMENYYGSAEADPNKPKSIGTGNLDSSGIPTQITLHLKLMDEEGGSIVLYEELGNWGSAQNWQYDIELADAADISIRCRGLKKLVLWIAYNSIALD